MITIKLTSVMVDDQRKALAFYTDKVGFVKSKDIPVGDYSWLTVVSPSAPDVELLLEPNENPAGKTFQQAIYEQGIPFTAFASDDIQADFERLSAAGVEFRTPPTETPGATIAMFEDTCGNLIQIFQPNGEA